MDSARYAARIDTLCTGELAAEHGGPDVLMAGPGYCVLALPVCGPPGDPAEEARAGADHLALLLDGRWGAQHPPWGTVTLEVRAVRGEALPEPWATVGALVPEIRLWQPPGTARWIAVGVREATGETPPGLLLLATDVDPP
jgi:hypothetical protein